MQNAHTCERPYVCLSESWYFSPAVTAPILQSEMLRKKKNLCPQSQTERSSERRWLPHAGLTLPTGEQLQLFLKHKDLTCSNQVFMSHLRTRNQNSVSIYAFTITKKTAECDGLSHPNAQILLEPFFVLYGKVSTTKSTNMVRQRNIVQPCSYC